MVKLILIIFCLLCGFGCEAVPTYTSHQEYKEITEWDHEKGIVKNPKASASWGIQWEH